MKKSVVTFLIFFISIVPLFAQDQTYRKLARKTEGTFNIDGLLDEADWEKAPDAGRLLYIKPGETGLAEAKTTIKLLFNDEYLYIGVLCYDSDPDKIEAFTVGDDTDLRDEDSVYFLFETPFEPDYYYVFATNLKGAKYDGRITKDGTTLETQWKGIWKVAAQKTRFGWTVEAEIDLAGLFYKPEDDKTIGLSISRLIPRMLESSFWTGPLDPAFSITRDTILPKIELIKKARDYSFIPYAFLKYGGGKDDANPDPDEINLRFSLKAGLDASYTFSEKTKAQLTFNPDFETAPPDQEQHNLTRFELRLKETRDFLKVDSQNYETPIPLFYSKRIGDVYGGLRYDSSSETFSLSGMSLQTTKIAPTDTPTANYSVIRMRKKFGKSFTLGLTAANKLQSGGNAGAAGIDARLNLTQNLHIDSQFAFSYGQKGEENLAFTLRPTYQTETFHLHLWYSQLGEEFGDNVNEVGFIEDDNRKELDAAIWKIFNLKRKTFDKLTFRTRYNTYWGMDNTLRSWLFDGGLTLNFTNKFYFMSSYFSEYKLYEKEFRNHHTYLEFGYDGGDWKKISIDLTFGVNYDRRFQLSRINKQVLAFRNLYLIYSYAAFHRPARLHNVGHTTRNIHFLNARYIHSDNLVFTLYAQINTGIQKHYIQASLDYKIKSSLHMEWIVLAGDPLFGADNAGKASVLVKFTYIY
ncbi:MAG: carbohydrate binding family 9 domain-containing protein [Candidatus Aminicenantes bacterium]|nr:carbohydrate binding family 9 domain-containing protein [Candidatus Aminicenantes bacterium]